MRPTDRKLKYQIDKLIRTAKTGIVGELWFELNEEYVVSFMMACQHLCRKNLIEKRLEVNVR